MAQIFPLLDYFSSQQFRLTLVLIVRIYSAPVLKSHSFTSIDEISSLNVSRLQQVCPRKVHMFPVSRGYNVIVLLFTSSALAFLRNLSTGKFSFLILESLVRLFHRSTAIYDSGWTFFVINNVLFNSHLKSSPVLGMTKKKRKQENCL